MIETLVYLLGAGLVGAATALLLLRWFGKEAVQVKAEEDRPFKAVPFTDKDGQHRFRIVAANGEPVAQSQGYSRKIDARTIAAQLVGEENVEAEEE